MPGSTNYPNSLDNLVDGTSRAYAEPVVALEKYGLPVYNVRTYGGAKGDGSTDDSPAIQACINAAGVVGGGIVFLPYGTYYIASGLTINTPITLMGVGWDPICTRGSIIKVTSTSINPIVITNGSGNGAVVRDIGFWYSQPTPGAGWAPSGYAYTMQIHATDVLVENVNLFNCTNGILSNNSGSSVGRNTFRRIWGQPLTTGIFIDDALDIMRFEDIHFWPFWSTDTNVATYQAANSTAMFSGRNDNPQYTNIFTLGYQYGMKFVYGAQGVTSRFRITNADFDASSGGKTIGISVQGNSGATGTTGVMTNVSAYGSIEILASAGTTAMVQMLNVRVSSANLSAITVSGGFAMLDSVYIDGFDVTNTASIYAITVNTGATLWLGHMRQITGGGTGGTADAGGAGSISKAL